MKRELLPPYLNISEVALFIDPNYKASFLLRMAEFGEISLYWKSPSEAAKVVYVLDGGFLPGSHEDIGNKFISLTQKQIAEANRLYNLEISFPSDNKINTRICASYLKDDRTLEVLFPNDWDSLCIIESDDINNPFKTFHEYSCYFDIDDILMKCEDILNLIDNSIINKSPIKDTDDILPEGKRKSSYLRVISELSEALIEGLTGKPDKDAETILVALNNKQISPSIKKDALANYLKEANAIKAKDKK